MGIIYRYSHPFNDHGYVGQTERTVEERDQQRFAPSHKEDCKSLKAAMVIYGKENFTLETIEEGIPSELLNEREKYWVAYFDDFHNGYNQTIGGGGTGAGENHPFFGRKHKQKSKEKMSESRKGEKNGMFGKGHPFFGRKHKQKSKEKMSESRKGEKNGMFGKGHLIAGENNSPRFGKGHLIVNGENNPNFGKKHPEHSKRMSGKKNPAWGIAPANKRPEYTQARVFFFLCIAPMEIGIRHKRQYLYKEFPQVPEVTLRKWVKTWIGNAPIEPKKKVRK